jgi:hypothetical protein
LEVEERGPEAERLSEAEPTNRMPGVSALGYDDIREAAPETVAKLVRDGTDARMLFFTVQRQVAAVVDGCDRVAEADAMVSTCNRLGCLLASWEQHDSNSVDYWRAVEEACHELHSEIADPLDRLPLGCTEVLLEAIRYAAERRYDEGEASPHARTRASTVSAAEDN